MFVPDSVVSVMESKGGCQVQLRSANRCILGIPPGPTLPLPTNLPPCWVQTWPERKFVVADVNSHFAQLVGVAELHVTRPLQTMLSVRGVPIGELVPWRITWLPPAPDWTASDVLQYCWKLKQVVCWMDGVVPNVKPSAAVNLRAIFQFDVNDPGSSNLPSAA